MKDLMHLMNPPSDRHPITSTKGRPVVNSTRESVCSPQVRTHALSETQLTFNWSLKCIVISQLDAGGAI